MAATIVLIFSVNILGQQPDQKARGCVTDEGKQLNFLVGDWNVDSEYRLRGGTNEWERTRGTSKIKFVFDQCLLSEKLNVTREGRPLTVVAFYSYNNFSKIYQWAFAHSEHGLLSLYEGPLEENRFVFKYSAKFGDRTILFKRILTKSPKGFELVAKRSNDYGKNWGVSWRLSYYRQRL